jgi:hypothetical protein
MQSFTSVPIADIDYLLKSNNLSLNKDKYLTSWNFIISNSGVDVPVSIADYVVAYNLQRENIPVMTVFDVVTSNYKIIGLNTERTIRVLRYLNKLDENAFIELPDEIIVKILSELPCDQILTLCKISKRFNDICKHHRRALFDRFLKGFTIAEYNPRIICKALDLNERIITIETLKNSKIKKLTLYIGSYGKLLFMTVKKLMLN